MVLHHLFFSFTIVHLFIFISFFPVVRKFLMPANFNQKIYVLPSSPPWKASFLTCVSPLGRVMCYVVESLREGIDYVVYFTSVYFIFTDSSLIYSIFNYSKKLYFFSTFINLFITIYHFILLPYLSDLFWFNLKINVNFIFISNINFIYLTSISHT